MANQELVAYINGEKAKGVSLPDIIATLNKSGWATNDIQEAVTATSAPMGSSVSFAPQPFRPPVNEQAREQIRTSISPASPASSSVTTATKSHFWLGFLIGAISSAVIGALLMYATAGWLLPKLTGVNEANDLLNNLQNNSYTPPPQNNTYPVAPTSSVPKATSSVTPGTVTPTPTTQSKTQTTQTQTTPNTTGTPAPTTPTPAPTYVATWHRVGEVSGDSATQTDIFAIKGTKWRINWDAVASADFEGGQFKFYPETSSGSSACTEEFEIKTVGITKISGTFVCDQGNGSYLIDTNSFFVDWHYLIEDYY